LDLVLKINSASAHGEWVAYLCGFIIHSVVEFRKRNDGEMLKQNLGALNATISNSHLCPLLVTFVSTRRPSSGLRPPSPAPAGEGIYFVGRFPRVFAALKPWANFRSAFSAKNAAFVSKCCFAFS
jgi:hypothetical protein